MSKIYLKGILRLYDWISIMQGLITTNINKIKWSCYVGRGKICWAG
ncbi:hypothetical protein N8081_00305 [Pseudomonadota bacterium]|nr:hypothetical protein [Pseudomonadota bacterium]